MDTKEDEQSNGCIVENRAPFIIFNETASIPLLANIPHSSSYIPPQYRKDFLITDQELEREVLTLTDWYTDELYASSYQMGGSALVSQVSRFIVDTERFEQDSEEPMASRGMGVIYTKGCYLRDIRSAPTKEEREELLTRFYRPYHEALLRQTRKIIEAFGFCLILDCHSFPEKVLPYECNQEAYRPEVCIGTDRYHTPKKLIELVTGVCKEGGYSVECDTPFAGTIVPLSLYKDPRVFSIMLELKRSLYMDETTGRKTQRFCEALELVKKIVDATIVEVKTATLLQNPR